MNTVYWLGNKAYYIAMMPVLPGFKRVCGTPPLPEWEIRHVLSAAFWDPRKRNTLIRRLCDRLNQPVSRWGYTDEGLWTLIKRARFLKKLEVYDGWETVWVVPDHSQHLQAPEKKAESKAAGPSEAPRIYNPRWSHVDAKRDEATSRSSHAQDGDNVHLMASVGGVPDGETVTFRITDGMCDAGNG